jgi:transposase
MAGSTAARAPGRWPGGAGSPGSALTIPPSRSFCRTISTRSRTPRHASRGLTRQIEELTLFWSLAPLVRAFQAMRGVAFIVAMTIVAEAGDFTRFANPHQLIAYLGPVPSEHSSGSSVRRGGLTKTGNVLARRALIEAAWTYHMPARISRTPHDRIEAQPKAVRDTAWKAQVRLCARYRRLPASGKAKVVAVAAIARELAGFLWAIARQVQIASAQ